jgi:hypothetical protein
MSTFIGSSKRVVLKNVNSSKVLQIDTATTLSYYIIERIQNTEIVSIDYQVEKIDGRSTTILTTWTPIDILGVVDDVYTFDYTITGVTVDTKILLRFKVVDIDGVEAFIELNDLQVRT